MSQKENFTEQEWTGLLLAPVMAGTYIIVADVSIMAMPSEMKGMLKAMAEQPAPAEAQELVAALVADIKAKSAQKEKLDSPQLDDKQNPKPQLLALLKQHLAVLDEKGAPGEKAAFSAWLMAVAQATAEAGREGGFLGIGAVRVSDQEQAALAELKQAFGLA